MNKVTITVEYRDPLKPSRSVTCWPDEAAAEMRGLMFRVATGEYSAVYVARSEPLSMKQISSEAPTI